MRIEHVEKALYGINVLDDFMLNIFQKEIVNLIGLADSGKNMLINVLSGIETIDQGRVYIDETPVDLINRTLSPQNGIFCIRQQTVLVQQLSIGENIFLIKRNNTRKFLINKRAIDAQTALLLSRIDLPIPSDTLAERLTLAQQHLIEILKAIIQGVKLIVLDDTADTYTRKEVEKLNETLLYAKAQGISILYVSHQLENITLLSDRVVIMRGGKNVRVIWSNDLNPREVPALLLGRLYAEQSPRKPRVRDRVAMTVRELSCSGDVSDISFQLFSGEILGILDPENKANLSLAGLLTGQIKRSSGRIELNGKSFSPRSLYSAIKEGVGLISSADLEMGILPNLTETENLNIMILKKTSHAKILVNERVIRYSWTKFLDHITHNNNEKQNGIYESLRILYWRWLLYFPSVLVCVNPCAYADMMMREIILSSLDEGAREGIGILICSSDISELSLLCDRILILHKGECIGELSKDEISNGEIINLYAKYVVAM